MGYALRNRLGTPKDTSPLSLGRGSIADRLGFRMEIDAESQHSNELTRGSLLYKRARGKGCRAAKSERVTSRSKAAFVVTCVA